MGKAARRGADRRKQEMRTIISVESERWGRPGTALEARWIAELLELPTVRVTRLPEEVLLSQGMVPKKCHLNCNKMAREDFTGETVHVPGWWISGPTLMLHSVVCIGGKHWGCITPQLVDAPGVFDFIPDPAIEWVSDDLGRMNLVREGQDLPVGLRVYPERHVAMHQMFLNLVAAGVDPIEAYGQVDSSLGAELMLLPLRP